LVTGFHGSEQISHLFSFELSLIAPNTTTIDFSKLMGNDITLSVATPGEDEATDWRYISGICASFTQGNRNEEFTSYYAEVVPKVWLLTCRTQCRIFQQKSVPDILKEVLKGFDCDFQLRGQYEHREYCVQYRETDFNFANRLMEEEGIYFFFKHSRNGHKMIIADATQAHSDVPGLLKAKYDVVEGGGPKGDHIFEWRKTQELRASKYSLWDHSFQQPTRNLEAKENILESVRAGSVSHQLKPQAVDPLEIYDFPGGYALRFDGISPGGGEQPDRLQKILEDNKRTVKLRMEAEALQSLTIQGTSGCRNFVAGHKFTLQRHFDADGDYVLVSVTHEASMGSAYRTAGNGGDLKYSNIFTCIPFQLPYRPQRRTPKPVLQGVQNALVTGPPGEEIFTDKYGRVKVQFYWDRQGKKDANSSCWLRVSTYWAGKRWGAMQVPRIGQEVVVAFVEGNPDEPVIVGSVYNPETMPPYSPGKGVISGLKSNTHKGKGYNEMSMDDTAGKEKITIHGQYDINTTVEHDQTDIVHNNRSITIDGTHTETIKKDTTIKITEGKLVHEVTSKTADYSVKGAVTEKFDATQETTVKSNITITSSEGDILIEAKKSITLHTGESKITMEQNGNITLEGVNIRSLGKTLVHCSAPTVEAAGTQTASMGVGRQSITCDTSKVLVSGAGITATAVGVHEISGAMVKIN
jgi:type VI secretion system secreted protein VgrG